ncbi:hypothetical protein ODJ79_44940 [Actinoplanes sp. KI2]|uniref:hypothetical protein n=1 Tax=Actinoplanes sp. KI2 TaxID=2983315 RepID=UPI0021D5F589|nr:hypothetical protein [Actinoplanes sp. KI2]MCU7730906.1 hypothetical protein [Actinoplanes sp. KI2]
MSPVLAAARRLERQAKDAGLGVWALEEIQLSVEDLIDSFEAVAVEADPLDWIPALPDRAFAAIRTCWELHYGSSVDTSVEDYPSFRRLKKFARPIFIPVDHESTRSLIGHYRAVARAACERVRGSTRRPALQHLQYLEDSLTADGWRRLCQGAEVSNLPFEDPCFGPIVELTGSRYRHLDVEIVFLLAEFALQFRNEPYSGDVDEEYWGPLIDEGIRIYLSFLASATEMTLGETDLNWELGCLRDIPDGLLEPEDWQVARAWKFRPSRLLQSFCDSGQEDAVDAYYVAADQFVIRLRTRLMAESGSVATRDVDHYRSLLVEWRAQTDVGGA